MTSTQDALLALAQARRAQREALSIKAMLAAARLWRRLALGALTESWDSGTGRDLYLLTSAAQLSSAGGAGEYLTRALALQDVDPGGAIGEPVPGSLAGISSSGLSLQGLLYQPVISTKERIGDGMDAYESFAVGQRQLQTIVATQVIDAGRVMDGVALHSRAKRLGYVRVLTPPSCARCAILAGQYYSSERAFQRHPRCDCIHLPIGDPGLADDVLTSPKDYFASLSKADQDRYFTSSGAQAIRDGSDMGRVINARKGMYDAAKGFKATTVGPTKGIRGARLMPEAIYKLASDQAEIVALLRRYGYLA